MLYTACIGTHSFESTPRSELRNRDANRDDVDSMRMGCCESLTMSWKEPGIRTFTPSGVCGLFRSVGILLYPRQANVRTPHRSELGGTVYTRVVKAMRIAWATRCPRSQTGRGSGASDPPCWSQWHHIRAVRPCSGSCSYSAAQSQPLKSHPRARAGHDRVRIAHEGGPGGHAFLFERVRPSFRSIRVPFGDCQGHRCE